MGPKNITGSRKALFAPFLLLAIFLVGNLPTLSFAGTTPPDCVSVTGNITWEETVGDFDGIPEPGESGKLYIEVFNPNVSVPVSGGTAWIYDYGDPPHIFPSVDYANYGLIPPGEKGTNLTPFEVTIDSNAPCRPYEIWMDYSDPNDIYCPSSRILIPIGGGADVLYNEDFEDGGANFSQPDLWHVDQDGSCLSNAGYYSTISGTSALAFNDPISCTYGEQITWVSATQYQSLSIDDTHESLQLSFWHLLESDFYDFLSVEASKDGEVYDTLGNYYGAQNWRYESIPLDKYIGGPLLLRFVFGSEGVSPPRLGWYIDDFKITAYQSDCEYTTPVITPTPTPTPCPTGTPYQTINTPEPTPTISPSPTPPITEAALLSVTATTPNLIAEHTGYTYPGRRTFVGFWTRRLNDPAEGWMYHGFLEYFDNDTTTTMDWTPAAGSTYQIAVRLYVEGLGWYGEHIYNFFSDLGNLTLPVLGTTDYDESGTGTVVASFSEPGTLPAQLGFWYRPVYIPETYPPMPVEALGDWVYGGLTPVPLLGSELQIPFDRFAHPEMNTDIFEIATRLYLPDRGFFGDYAFNYAPNHVVAYPAISDIWLSNETATATIRFSPVGNMDNYRAGFWFREIIPGICQPICDWAFLGYHDYTPLTRSLEIPWYPANPQGVHEAAARGYMDDGEYRGWITPFGIAGDRCDDGETTPLMVIDSYPAQGDEVVTEVWSQFSRDVDPVSVNTVTFTLEQVSLYDSVTTPVTNGELILPSPGSALMSFPEPLPNGYYKLSLGGITDKEGLPLIPFTNYFYVGGTIYWIAGDGEWDNPDNWNLNRVPTASDFAVISVPGNAVVHHQTGSTITAGGLFARNLLEVSQGTLEVSGPMWVNKLHIASYVQAGTIRFNKLGIEINGLGTGESGFLSVLNPLDLSRSDFYAALEEVPLFGGAFLPFISAPQINGTFQNDEIIPPLPFLMYYYIEYDPNMTSLVIMEEYVLTGPEDSKAE